MTKITKFVMPKLFKITQNLLCENVENHAIFVEGFWPEFYARGRFMKYSMSDVVDTNFPFHATIICLEKTDI